MYCPGCMLRRMLSSRASLPACRSSSPCSSSQSYGKSGWEAKGIMAWPIRKSCILRSAFQRMMVFRPSMFSRIRVRTFSASCRLANRQVRLVPAGIVRFFVGSPRRITLLLYTSRTLPNVLAFSRAPFRRNERRPGHGRSVLTLDSCSRPLTGLLALLQYKGYRHIDLVARNVAVLDHDVHVLDPGALDVAEGAGCAVDALVDGILEALFRRGA